MADRQRTPTPDEGPDATAGESRAAARDDDYEAAQEQVRQAEEAHELGDPAAGEVEEWPDSDAASNPVAPGDDLKRIRDDD